MSTTSLDGKRYAEMLLSGTACLSERRDEINALNVFPVADGDTGTNMQKTLEGGLSEISGEISEDISEISKKFSHGALLGARGNSGVILSQIFAGINECLSRCERADACSLAEAYRNGIKRSYSSVSNPTEGTILTVFRESTEYAAGKVSECTSVEEFYELLIEEAKRSLQRTKELLPVLEEEDVVDSGAMGYLSMAEGMYEALIGRPHKFTESGERSEVVDISRFTRDSELKFGYCTEFLLRLTDAKVDVDGFDINTVLSDLSDLSGESVVAYKEGDIVKVHVHTFTPGDILSRMQRYGEFLTVKIENMSLGHSKAIKEEEKEEVKRKRKNTKYSVVTVASGDGLTALFESLGADIVISGGQTSNPSVEEFVSAFSRCEPDDIIVLPNNKNVILAAEGAAKLTPNKRVHIVETKNIPEGYAAISVISPMVSDINVLVEGARRAAKSVTSAEITRAVRDAVVDGVSVKTGEYMAISDGEILALEGASGDSLLSMLEKIDMDDYEIMTLFVGLDVTDKERVAITEAIEREYPDIEVTVHIGGQSVYDYLVSLE